MKLSVPFQRIAAVLAIGAAAVVVPVMSSSTPVSAACEWCAGGEYHALTPARVLDTRPAPDSINDVAPVGLKPLSVADSTFTVQLLDRGGLPASTSDVLAVAASITVVNPSRYGFLSAYAPGSPSNSSVVNFTAGQNVSNMAVLRPNTSGQITIMLHGNARFTGDTAPGSAHVIIDVSGWWSTSGYTAGTPADEADERGARLFSPAAPGRIIDSRPSGTNPSTPANPTTPLAAGEYRQVQIRGARTLVGNTEVVPNSGNVVGVLLNVTAVGPTARTFLSVVPAATPGVAPATSNINLGSGQTKANLVLVPVSGDGKVFVYNHAGNTQVLVDVMGYMINGEPETTRRGRVIPLTSPFRTFDTRESAFGGVPLGPGQAEDWSFANFASSVTVAGVSVGAQSGFLGNLTNASLVRQYSTVPLPTSYLTVCPGVCPANAQNIPNYSNLNTVEGAAVPNLTLVPYGANNIVRVFNARGYAHYILDVSAVILA